jgi:hypothetical protein
MTSGRNPYTDHRSARTVPAKRQDATIRGAASSGLAAGRRDETTCRESEMLRISLVRHEPQVPITYLLDAA